MFVAFVVVIVMRVLTAVAGGQRQGAAVTQRGDNPRNTRWRLRCAHKPTEKVCVCVATRSRCFFVDGGSEARTKRQRETD